MNLLSFVTIEICLLAFFRLSLVKTRGMIKWLQLALEVQEYVHEEGRTLAVSQGKMLRDSDPKFQYHFDKQTA